MLLLAGLHQAAAQVSFAPAAAYAVGSQPTSVAAADVNGDGQVDLICANYNTNFLTVLTNNGSGSFARSGNYSVGSQPVCVIAADVNGDGWADLISANYGTNTLSVLTNNRSGRFVLSAVLNVGSSPAWVTAADVNGDGMVDLICANSGTNRLTVLTNNGSGGFVPSALLNVGNTPRSVTAADVNGDGWVDLICANNAGGTLSVLTNDGRGGFALSATLSVGTLPLSVAAADVNGDGWVDLISTGNTLTMVLTNNGKGAFTNSVSYAASGTECVIAADVNGDGWVDLICANYAVTNSNTLTVLTNNGSGGFGFNTNLTVGTGPFFVAAVDVNGDGRLDLVCPNLGNNTLSVLINTATFTPSGSLRVNLAPSGAVSAGAQWQVDTGAWQNSGTTAYRLSGGSHTVMFSTVAGWTTPTNQTATINTNQTTTAIGLYVQQFGSLQVNLTPADAVNAGAQWQVDGGAWQNSGATVTGLAVGSHSVTFNTINDWTTPISQTAVINNNQTTMTAGSYSPLGSLQVNLMPLAAVSAGAQWQVDGGAWQNSGNTVANLTLGNHTLSFLTVSNWATPADQTVEINSNQTTTVTGTYGQQFGALQVNISPPGAVSAGAQWQVDGGAWQNSGAIVSGLTSGSHTVGFLIMPGWGVPVSQIVTVIVNQTTTRMAAYLAPRSAMAMATMTNGFVVAVTLSDAGFGYTNTPLVWLIGGGGSGAQAVAVVSNGMVTAINVISTGSGYTNAPWVVIESPFIANPVMGIALMSSVAFSNLTVGGAYQLQRSVAWYWTNQTVSFTATDVSYTQMVAGVAGSGDYRLALSPAPTQAFATALVINKFFVGAPVTSGGSGYVTSPAVSIVGGGGTGATAVPQVFGGAVTNIVVTSTGGGYVNTPTVQIAPPPAVAVAPTVLPVMRLDSASLAPYDNYQIQFKPDLGAAWENWNDGLFSPTDVTNSQYLFLTNGVGFFRLQHVP